MNNIKAIIFDYDGVIAESVNVKTDAFAELYKPYGEDIIRKVIEHHESNGGLSRFDKFKIYHQDFLNKKIDKQEVNKLSKQFSNLVLQKVIDSPFVKGAYDFIVSNHEKYDFFISTGTPTEEIKIILESNKLRFFFKDIFGSPEKKNIHVRRIMDKYKYKKSEVLFIGDALTDRDAAKANGIKFVGRFTTSPEIKDETYLIDDFLSIENILEIV
jgi:phosphoglycolate phosphatase-like HAD superfamily hydrolase